VHKAIAFAVKRVEYVIVKISNTIPKRCWCHIIIQKVHAPTEMNFMI
jgi:hypothetical protein